MDIKTLLLMLAMGNLTLAAALMLYEYSATSQFSRSSWPYSKLLQGVAWTLFYLRGEIAPLVSILFANITLFVGIAIEAGAMWEAREHQEWRKHLLLPLCLGIGLFSLAFITAQAPYVLVSIASLVVSFMYTAGAIAFLQGWREASFLRRFIALSTLFLALLIGLRAVWAWLTPVQADLFHPALIQQISFLSLYLLMMVNGFGFLLIQREKQELELQRLAVVDPLTNAPNRRGFYNALMPWLSLARRPGHSTALIMFDLDHFKRVNDTYGHQVGDQVLKVMVEVGQQQLRDSDMLGRLGGEEFAVLLPRTSLADAKSVAERMRQAIGSAPIKAERALIYITVSMGVTIIRPEDSVVSLFKRADEAMYAAKQAGRNTICEADFAAQALA